MEKVNGIAIGFMGLGFSFLVIDYFLAKLLRKMYPDPSYWEEELKSPELTASARKNLERRRRAYLNGISHRFRNWGLALLVFGGLLFATFGIIRVSR